MSDSNPPGGTGVRLHSLDGLRGVAALVVLIHHALLTFPSLADAYYDLDARNSISVPWLISYTPLHAFWAGTEAVYLFFILSGIVLVLPTIRAGRSFSWLAYYPRRLIRLYVPVIAAVALGALLTVIAVRFQDPALGAWMNARKEGYTPQWLARDVTLLFGSSGVVSPLWSLRWEILFSLLLPAFVALAVFARRWWWPKLIIVISLIAVGAVIDNPYIFLLPMFGIGALLISEWDRIGRAARRLGARSWVWPALVVVAALLTTSKWTLLGFGFDEANVRFVVWLPVLGVGLFILIGGFWAPAVRCLEIRPVAWLGQVSFSLYLVHEPIIIAARILTFPLSPWLGLLIAVPLAFVVAEVFRRAVEQPAHALSKRAGSWVARTLRPVPR